MNYDWQFGRLLPYLKAFEVGTLTTLWLFVVVVVCGTMGGIIIGLLLRSRLVYAILLLPLDLLRAVPPVVLILFAYYALTDQVIGITVDTFWTCAVALSINLAAFVADLVRSASESVPRGDVEAAHVLGFSQWQTFRHITFSLILRNLAVPMLMLYIGMLKATSLGSVIGVREVVYSGQVVIASTTRSLETWVVVSAVYVVIVVPMSFAARRLETWARRGQPQHLSI